MSKYDTLTEIAKKISVLDNEVKLKILALLIEEGSKSITDISRDLNINFSTAHKYLEQLEAAGLVSSKQVSENRMKRLFTIKDFDINLSPTGISEAINGKSSKESKKGLKVINEKGELVDFDEKTFSQKYLKRGMPRGVIVSAISAILEDTYDGVTLLELRRKFSTELNKKAENIKNVFAQIESDEKHKRTFAHLLSVTHPEALDMHANGDIFIKNLREPKLLNFVHDLRGIAVHGTRGKKVSNLPEFLSEIAFAIEFMNKFTKIQAMDSLNTHLSPFCETLTRTAVREELVKFFNRLPQDIKIFISIDIGTPKFSNLPTEYLPEKHDTTYARFTNSAQIVAEEILRFFKANPDKFCLTLKAWEKVDPQLLKDLDYIYVANMRQEWQHPNASYVGPMARFDAAWKNWPGTQRVGELQKIVINLPRIARRAKNTEDFLSELQLTLARILEFLDNMSELIVADFFRKHNTHLTSAKQGKWNYVPIENCTHAIAITGLSDALKVLAGNTAADLKLIEKILKTCANYINKNTAMPIRIVLKEDDDANISHRFYALDSRGVKLPSRDYVVGMGCSDPNLMAAACKLQKYLVGGHCIQATKSQLHELLKGEFGLVRIK